MDPLIGILCTRPDNGPDVAMYTALHTTLSLDDALNLLEIRQVWSTAKDAAEANAAAHHETKRPPKRKRGKRDRS